MTKELADYLRGWRGYFGFCETPSVLERLDQWIRPSAAFLIWKQWKHGKVRYAQLCKRGVNQALAAKTARSAHGPWHTVNSPGLSHALPIAYFDALGVPRLCLDLNSIHPNRRMRNRMSGGVAGASG